MELNKNDFIGIVSLSDKPDRTKVLSGKKKIEDLGYSVVLGKNIFSGYGCFAGTDKDRSEDFNRMICDSKIKAVFFSRGGYGSARILNLIDYSSIKKNKKIIMGFSDITSLLNAVYCKTGVTTFHGPMTGTDWAGRGLSDITKKFFTEMFISKNREIDLDIKKELRPYIVNASCRKKTSGILLGGCLSVFQTLIGTGYLKLIKDYVLFLEDINEEPYVIDRMLTHLRNSSFFKGCRGIIYDFKNCRPSLKNKKTHSIIRIMRDIFSGFSYPVLRWEYFGHRKNKVILPIGQKITIDLNKRKINIKLNYKKNY